MPNAAPVPVRKSDTIDPRVLRTTRALGNALVALVQERNFDDLSVQEILDRAGVGRTTFYAHYRNKEDALHSSYERVFEWLEPFVANASSSGPRLFPVTELLEHVQQWRAAVDALDRAGRLGDAWEMLTGYATRTIARRLPRSAPSAEGMAMPQSLAARMLAGALTESVRWWFDRPGAATPAAMDTAFHRVAHALITGNS